MAFLYLVVSVPVLIALNLVFADFHAPDDTSHFERAYTLSRGAFLPITERGRSSGGLIDVALARYLDLQSPAVTRGWSKQGELTAPLQASAADRAALHWTDKLQYSEFPGAASYFPLLYVPQTVAIWLGKGLDLTVSETVLLARAFNGSAAVLLIAAALSLCPFSAVVAVILLLPKTLVQFASNSADPMLHAITLLAVALFCRALVQQHRLSAGWYGALALGFLVAVPVRPPLIGVALLPLWLCWRDRNALGAAIICAGCGLALAWTGTVLPEITDLRCGQVASLRDQVLRFLSEGPALMARSGWLHKAYYVKSFIGELGWGDGPHSQLNELPSVIYYAGLIVMMCAITVDSAAPIRIPLHARFIALLSAVLGIVATFFAMFVVCTSTSTVGIGGVQGRDPVGPLICAVPAIWGLIRMPLAFRPQLFLVVLFCFSTGAYAVLLQEGLRLYWVR